MLNHSDVIPIGGCLGGTAKLGPCARRETCTSVNEVLERFLTHLLMYSLVVVSVVVVVVIVSGVSSVDVMVSAGKFPLALCTLCLSGHW